MDINTGINTLIGALLSMLVSYLTTTNMDSRLKMLIGAAACFLSAVLVASLQGQFTWAGWGSTAALISLGFAGGKVYWLKYFNIKLEEAGPIKSPPQMQPAKGEF